VSVVERDLEEVANNGGIRGLGSVKLLQGIICPRDVGHRTLFRKGIDEIQLEVIQPHESEGRMCARYSTKSIHRFCGSTVPLERIEIELKSEDPRHNLLCDI
jgi:hypothetical protein